jgi:hypothetical protein
MSKQAVEQVVRKASTDARFRAQLAGDFDVAVKPFKLTAAEKAHLRKGASISATAKVPERQAARQAARQEARQAARVSERVAARVTERVAARVTERVASRAVSRATTE